MSTQATIHCYYLIIDKLRKALYPTKKEHFDYLYEEGLVNSIRSLERRIEEIRTEFHLEIPYNARTNSYSLSDEDKKSLNDLLRFLELNTITRIFGDSIKVSREAIKHFSFDTDGSFHGISILKTLLNAIQTRHRINFTYQKFQENTVSERNDFCPLILREYLGRWYIGGNFQESNRLFTFGLDRMNSISILEETYTS